MTSERIKGSKERVEMDGTGDREGSEERHLTKEGWQGKL